MWHDDELEPLAPIRIAGMSGTSLLRAWYETELLLGGRGPTVPGRRGEPRPIDRRIHDFVEHEIGAFARRRVPVGCRIGHNTLIRLARWYCAEAGTGRPFRWYDMPAEEQAFRHALNVCSALCAVDDSGAPCRHQTIEDRAIRALTAYLEGAADARGEL